MVLGCVPCPNQEETVRLFGSALPGGQSGGGGEDGSCFLGQGAGLSFFIYSLLGRIPHTLRAEGAAPAGMHALFNNSLPANPGALIVCVWLHAGINENGQLGINSTASTAWPTAVLTPSGGTAGYNPIAWAKLSAGLSHTCGIINSTGSLWCWGACSFASIRPTRLR